MRRRAAGRAVLALLAAPASLLVAGCATRPRAQPEPGVRSWSGRLVLAVDGTQPFSAAFELKGAPAAGELSLFNPLGGTAGVLSWAPGAATLRTSDGVRQFPSLEALAQEVTGAPLPIAALFDWLAGRPTEAAGWRADVSQVAQGRLRAQRASPPPAADLRVVFDH